MPHILKNKSLEVHFDLPLEGYNFSRFDWTGKITHVKFKGVPVTTIERTDDVDANLFGKGLYNEFGIEAAIGFEETEPGDWFHKIGVGALKKTDGPYQFTTPYKIRPAIFHVKPQGDILCITCLSDNLNGYAYRLKKEFRIQENALVIQYELENTGQKSINTDEYVHNFMGVDNDLIGKEYELRFQFKLEEQEFQMLVNPEGKMELLTEKISFNGNPKQQFFISHLNGTQTVTAYWELIHKNSGIGIRESGSFDTQKVNLWGWEHVVSPELFYEINIAPGDTITWWRHYNFFSIP